jgi:hypothetical protein
LGELKWLQNVLELDEGEEEVADMEGHRQHHRTEEEDECRGQP